MTSPKSKRWSFWLLAATALLSIGAWQAARISMDLKADATAVKPPPKKTRSDGRKPLAKELAQADPVGAYLARAKRGMKDQEIRWIEEDFRGASLDMYPSAGDSLLHQRAYRARQQEWYAAALGDGLALSKGQREEVANSLSRLLESEFGGEDIKLSRIWIDTMMGSWLGGPGYAPWNLCHLTPGQLSLTTKSSSAENWDQGGVWTSIWAFPVIQDPLTGKQIPFINTSPRDDTQNPSHLYLPGAGVFPLTPAQTIAVADHPEAATLPPESLDQARRYQPAQYRVALLLSQTGHTVFPMEAANPPVATSPSPAPDSAR
ncbi:MAG: hypothetical protein QM755_17410 [Luteolibacter sp.]